MPSTRLVLIRHGDSHHKHEGIIGGPKGDRGLTDLGREQARRVGARLGKTLAAAAPVYCSTLPRAIETAAIVATQIRAQAPRQDCRLCTWHVPPDADGRIWEEHRRDAALRGGGVFHPFEEGNEVWAELVTRTSQALIDIARANQNATAVVVAHYEMIEASLIGLGGLPLMRSFDVRVDAASLTEWITDDDPWVWPPARWQMARFNETGHLED